VRTPRSWPTRLLAALRERCPTVKRVELRIVKRIRVKGAAGAVGCCVDKGDHFVIYLEAGHEWPTVKDTVAHEWAHALSHKSKADHGRAFGIAYAKAYRASLKWWEVA